MSIDPGKLRELADDPELMDAVRLKLEDTLVEMRDSCMFTPNRNGLAIHDRDGEPNGVIRIGTGWAIQIALRAIADELASRAKPSKASE